ncbi:histidine phosphatase family protein [Mesobacillus maritimus]|uniref:histidine phosphatase family protein n=1 Tax=Mesobacillus maritimus TaxID=1643336 RepID=UPI00384D0A10
MKQIYVIRHCEAEGQPSEAQLTKRGMKQALDLSELLSYIKVDRIISSPYKRAMETIEPLAKNLNIEVEVDSRLTERILSTHNMSDWFENLRNTFEDLELKFEGGESSREAMKRVVEVVEEIFNSNIDNTIIVTHGNLMSLLLKHFNSEYGFEDWKNLSNPDVFLIKNEKNKVTFERIWE